MTIKAKRPGTGIKDANRYMVFGRSNRETGLPFQKFRSSPKFSSGMNQKVVFYLLPGWNFQKFLVNGKQPQLPAKHEQKSAVLWVVILPSRSWIKEDAKYITVFFFSNVTCTPSRPTLSLVSRDTRLQRRCLYYATRCQQAKHLEKWTKQNLTNVPNLHN